MTLECFVAAKKATPIILLTKDEYPKWLKLQSSAVKTWLNNAGMSSKKRHPILVPNDKGAVELVVYTYEADDLWEFGKLPKILPEGVYQLSKDSPITKNAALGWALECYRFDRFKAKAKSFPKLAWPQHSAEAKIAEVVYWVRDLINRPANDLNPAALAAEAEGLAQDYGANIKVFSGDDLLEQNFPAMHAVGRAGPTSHLIDLRWGKPTDPKVTLVGKGVCFDSGGLNLKPTRGMRFMKKDMGGAAHALGLGRMIMEEKLPLQLRIIIAAVENGVSANAMRPGDIIQTRKGLSIEVENTDAEGRVILADCLTLAVEDKPDIIIDFATLTGAARVALGTDVPALFSNDESLSEGLLHHCTKERDDVWKMPLWQGYRSHIESAVADLSNNSSSVYGGAITAALFLENFVEDTPWAHIDMMAWNLSSRPGRPEGGEACAIRGIYSYLKDRHGRK